ncbi:bifunctional adenosylcobinamide kinase/adenosylcobinamide-phosphate guanylyltransferase [Ectothiorhodospira lacustris]|uniref:bifunctional adenosylcobinamide kinase/adenosylcobinamide-phosphate guanylyltransferase n=1 Tax=Ectothiorhodospira lacustris TaxID=2899127 RepID=UPI001EE917AF|nr:bifunctional adenosylcobinamide kinase/adenosylcobinamide-phosphate guanylyltransferase [Ectothiorhodospira lacustris]MCG5511007.1 bifunctional adenosylcobinamide kinase/adenosylcobinamide-phosphate guanylyltransferase [Ectothiorhodospira lacustris]MCG5522737.1 bifunctional adenosylcobinamide kinase/adenosylcobinamide-phosphate guanylyltransferase [Ectothiorhodospira lacustris]
MKELILGGVRSGKSALAERLALASSLPVTYVATARPGEDEEMQQRIRHHRERRPPDWALVEAGPDLAAILARHARPGHCLLVDCLTLWLTHLLWDEDEQTCAREQEDFVAVLPRLPGRVIMVSNETSMGIVPLGELTRRFCDDAGRLHQAVAARADRVILTVAGLPHLLKGESL